MTFYARDVDNRLMTKARQQTVRTTISEARAEKMADAMVWRRLETDRAYNNAEDAKSQSLREAEIGAQVWREIEQRYDVS
jgi:hypothetical protein